MTVQITFTQRQMLDRVKKAGLSGLLTTFSSVTAFALVQRGYARWKETANGAKLPVLILTQKGENFYRF